MRVRRMEAMVDLLRLRAHRFKLVIWRSAAAAPREEEPLLPLAGAARQRCERAPAQHARCAHRSQLEKRANVTLNIQKHMSFDRRIQRWSRAAARHACRVSSARRIARAPCRERAQHLTVRAAPSAPGGTERQAALAQTSQVLLRACSACGRPCCRGLDPRRWA